jgi:hypothetical protein
MSSALRPTPNLEDQVSVFRFPSDRVAQLYPQAPGSLSITFYVSQRCGGGVLTRLHTGQFFYSASTYLTERKGKVVPVLN